MRNVQTRCLFSSLSSPPPPAGIGATASRTSKVWYSTETLGKADKVRKPAFLTTTIPLFAWICPSRHWHACTYAPVRLILHDCGKSKKLQANNACMRACKLFAHPSRNAGSSLQRTLRSLCEDTGTTIPILEVEGVAEGVMTEYATQNFHYHTYV
jgi:hypothetical protein